MQINLFDVIVYIVVAAVQAGQDMQMLAILQQAQLQEAATGALRDLDTRAEKLEAEIEKQQNQGLQVCTQM